MNSNVARNLFSISDPFTDDCQLAEIEMKGIQIKKLMVANDVWSKKN